MTELYTVGHSTHSMSRFLELLRQADIEAVADVRSVPISHRHPHFSRASLQQSLEQAQIGYAFLGRGLGGRASDPRLLDDFGRVDYRAVAQTDVFQASVLDLLAGAQRRRVALVCAEREPLNCHRTLLISRALVQHKADVAHIHHDGRLEHHDALEHRLLAATGLSNIDLFRSEEVVLDEAYRRQAAKVAFVDPAPRLEHARAAMSPE